MTVAFLTHPIGERDNYALRGDNLAAAVGWFRFVKEATGWAICFPAMAYVAAVDDVFHRPSMLTGCVEILERCDVVVVVGGHVSPHMRIEIAHAHNKCPPIPVLPLLDMGPIAPVGSDSHAADVRRRADALGL